MRSYSKASHFLRSFFFSWCYRKRFGLFTFGFFRFATSLPPLNSPSMGGFARIRNNEITVLVNDAEKGGDIDTQEAQQTLETAEANVKKAEGRKQKIEANLALRRDRTRVEASNSSFYSRKKLEGAKK